MRKLLPLLIIGINLLLSINIGLSEETTKYSEGNNIEVKIKFYNKNLYQIGKPIIVEIKITNLGQFPFTFFNADEKIFTYDFDVRTMSNRPVEHSKIYAIRRYQSKAIFYNEITLKQNESHSARINISEWFDFEKPGEYLIRGIFFPKLITDAEGIQIKSSNELLLELHPRYTEEIEKVVEVEKRKKLEAKPLPPYEVVGFLLDSLMNKDFESYFMYINFDRFIMQFENARKKYINAPDAKKPEVIEELKNYIRGKNELESIPFSQTIPNDYEIEKTIIEKSDAEVRVIETFILGRLVEKKRYTYYLHKYGDLWLLEGYRVVNLP